MKEVYMIDYYDKKCIVCGSKAIHEVNHLKLMRVTAGYYCVKCDHLYIFEDVKQVEHIKKDFQSKEFMDHSLKVCREQWKQ